MAVPDFSKISLKTRHTTRMLGLMQHGPGARAKGVSWCCVGSVVPTGWSQRPLLVRSRLAGSTRSTPCPPPTSTNSTRQPHETTGGAWVIVVIMVCVRTLTSLVRMVKSPRCLPCRVSSGPSTTPRNDGRPYTLMKLRASPRGGAWPSTSEWRGGEVDDDGMKISIDRPRDNR